MTRATRRRARRAKLGSRSRRGSHTAATAALRTSGLASRAHCSAAAKARSGSSSAARCNAIATPSRTRHRSSDACACSVSSCPSSPCPSSRPSATSPHTVANSSPLAMRRSAVAASASSPHAATSSRLPRGPGNPLLADRYGIQSSSVVSTRRWSCTLLTPQDRTTRRDGGDHGAPSGRRPGHVISPATETRVPTRPSGTARGTTHDPRRRPSRRW